MKRKRSQLAALNWTNVLCGSKVAGVNLDCCFKTSCVASFLLLTLFGGRLVHAGEIHGAAGKGNFERVEILLKANPDLISSKDMNGWTPLNQAAIKGHKIIAELLLTFKADVNTQDNDGNTPLHNAVKFKQMEMVEWLLTNKAAVDPRHKWNDWTPLHIAAVDGYLEASKLLLGHKADPTPKVNAV